jgi:plasmid stabilization system protein ParE
MAYNIIVSPRTLQEIEAAVDYYALHSVDAPKNFIDNLMKAYNKLEENPYKRLRYKNIRAIRLEKFPYLLYFVLNKKESTVLVLSCFHDKQNPLKRPNH